MAKKRSRRISYSTYKTLIPNCRAYDYDSSTKTIMVDLPDEILNNTEFTPCDWANKWRRSVGDIYDITVGYKSAEIYKKIRDGIAMYFAKVVSYSTDAPYGKVEQREFLNYKFAVDWCNTFF